MTRVNHNFRQPVLLNFLIAITVSVLLIGCTVGRNMVRPSPGSLILGVTTKQQILARYGEPWKRGTSIVNERSVTKLVYAFSGSGDALETGVTGARSIDMFFFNDVLVGYIFVSSFKTDHTDFDHTRIKEIKEGQDGCEKVLDVFGPAPGEMIFPLMKSKDMTGLVYNYTQTRTGFAKIDIYIKQLTITCDKNNNLVSEINYSTTGER